VCSFSLAVLRGICLQALETQTEGRCVCTCVHMPVCVHRHLQMHALASARVCACVSVWVCLCKCACGCGCVGAHASACALVRLQRCCKGHTELHSGSLFLLISPGVRCSQALKHDHLSPCALCCEYGCTFEKTAKQNKAFIMCV